MLKDEYFSKNFKTEPVIFHDVTSTFYTCSFAQKGNDMIYHFYGTPKCSSLAISQIIEPIFLETLGEDSRKNISVEFINDPLLDNLESVFVKVENLCKNELALKKMRRDVFELLHEKLGQRYA
jgi:hypothetical protein